MHACTVYVALPHAANTPPNTKHTNTTRPTYAPVGEGHSGCILAPLADGEGVAQHQPVGNAANRQAVALVKQRLQHRVFGAHAGEH